MKFFFPLRWKFALAIVTFSFVALATYVLMAKDAFESSMIAYTFDSEQSKVTKVAEDFDRAISNLSFLATSVIANFEFQRHALNTIGKKLFESQPDLLAIELSDGRGQKVVRIEKQAGDLAGCPAGSEMPKVDQTDVRPASAGRVVVTTGQRGDGGEVLRLRVLINVPNLFPFARDRSYFMGGAGAIILAQGDTFSKTDVAELNAEVTRARGGATLTRRVADQTVLVSSAHAKASGLAFYSVTPRDLALGGLRVLFKRSIAFCALAAFLIILLSLLLSRRLTRQLKDITNAAAEIGRGNFSPAGLVGSNDEMGILSTAFASMSREIARLLDQTRDKIRMEEELKTARLVQASLMPRADQFDLGEISVANFYVTSTECGGDWWHHFTKGDDLYIAIADATGHGTPAALITAVARAAFALIEKNDFTLPEMMRAWDTAVVACSNNRVFMTALLLRINVKTGRTTLLNASHEWPLLYHATPGGALEDGEFTMRSGPTLGEAGAGWVEHELDLKPGDRLVLYTDGLFAVVNDQGRQLNERRVKRLITNEVAPGSSVADLNQNLRRLVEMHRGSNALPDDVMTVVIGRAG